MTAIVSPKPRLASRRRAHSPTPVLSPPPLYLSDLPRRMASAGLASPPRLLSPIHLTDPSSYYSKASSSCTPANKKRRTQVSASRAARRRRSTRFDRPTPFPGGGSIFDQLAWIPQLNEEPEHTDVWDIADLSLLPIEAAHPSSVGPVRNRKSSLRSDSPYSSPITQDSSPRRPAPLQLAPTTAFPLFDRDHIDPRTPPPRETFSLENVQFFGLMPALPIHSSSSRSQLC
ncbi:hypothetical protein QCA50_003018 [Cerrena zonata]|uniref:Uncharacterized protein n=1 Tax=Cerrena zonata TaxID=2478898 RepID=A0AAW0GJF1_9APHY